jgi:hypothetical protein
MRAPMPCAAALLVASACAHDPTAAPSVPGGWEFAIVSPVPCPVDAGSCGGWRRPAAASSCAASFRFDEVPLEDIDVQFAVEVDGRATEIALPDGVPRATAAAIRSWLEGCALEPARNPAGEPVRVVASQPLHFTPGG